MYVYMREIGAEEVRANKCSSCVKGEQAGSAARNLQVSAS